MRARGRLFVRRRRLVRRRRRAQQRARAQYAPLDVQPLALLHLALEVVPAEQRLHAVAVWRALPAIQTPRDREHDDHAHDPRDHLEHDRDGRLPVLAVRRRRWGVGRGTRLRGRQVGGVGMWVHYGGGREDERLGRVRRRQRYVGERSSCQMLRLRVTTG